MQATTKSHATMLDAGLVALGGATLGGLLDTTLLLVGMGSLAVGRAGVALWERRVRVDVAPTHAARSRDRLGLWRPTRATRRSIRPARRSIRPARGAIWPSRRVRALDLEDLPQLTLVAPSDDAPDLAVIDALTGLPNRRGLERALEVACGRSARSNASIGVLVLSVRDAAQVRRIYGPQAARDVVRHAGQRLREALGDAGVVGRWGGEEFVVVVPGLRAQAAPLLAERYRRLLESEPYRLSSGRRVPVAVCAGWAASPRDGISGQFLVARAQSRAVVQASDTPVLTLG